MQGNRHAAAVDTVRVYALVREYSGGAKRLESVRKFCLFAVGPTKVGPQAEYELLRFRALKGFRNPLLTG